MSCVKTYRLGLQEMFLFLGETVHVLSFYQHDKLFNPSCFIFFTLATYL